MGLKPGIDTICVNTSGQIQHHSQDWYLLTALEQMLSHAGSGDFAGKHADCPKRWAGN